MFYSTVPIYDHPCYELNNILESFFLALANDEEWNINHFPTSVTLIDGRNDFIRRLQDMYTLLLNIDNDKREAIYQKFLNNNAINDLCSNHINLIENINIEGRTKKYLENFMLGLYPKKLDLNIFKRPNCSENPTRKFYQEFISQNGHICGFCGTLAHKHPFGVKRGDLDHYLLKSSYHFSAVNMNNLIPMCSECNQDYKHEANVLKDVNGNLQCFPYPYDGHTFSIIVESVEIIGDSYNFTFEIQDLNGVAGKDSFVEVFKLHSRYQRELSKRHYNWISKLCATYKLSNENPNLNDFKLFLQNQSTVIRRTSERVIEAELLEIAFYDFLSETDDQEINELYLDAFLQIDYL